MTPFDEINLLLHLSDRVYKRSYPRLHRGRILIWFSGTPCISRSSRGLLLYASSYY